MSLTFQNLSDVLPPGSIEYVGNNQLKLNFSQLTGNELALETSLLTGVVKLLQGLAKLTDEINTQHINHTPPLALIEFATQALGGTPQRPVYNFTVKIAVDSSNFIESLIDPTNTPTN